MKKNNLIIPIIFFFLTICTSSVINAKEVDDLRKNSVDSSIVLLDNNDESVCCYNFDMIRNSSLRINEIILSEIKYPEFAKLPEYQGLVYVECSINYDGTIKVSQINGNDEALNNYVKNEIESLYILPDLNAVKTNVFKFQFNRG